MASKKTTRIKASAIDAPKTREEAAGMVERIGSAQRERDRIQANMNDELSSVRKGFEDAAAVQQQIIDANFSAVQIYAEANRVDLLKGKLKTVKLSTGELSWRVRPPSVSLSKIQDVIAALRKAKLSRFIRKKEEVDKNAILADAEAVAKIKGIKVIKDAEDFVIKPFETELEESR